MKYILLVIFLTLPVTAHADWSNVGIRPVGAPNLNPAQSQPIHHDIKAPLVHAEPQHRTPPIQPTAHQPVRHDQPQRHDQPVNPNQARERRELAAPGYFHRDTVYYGVDQNDFPYADVDNGFVVPDGFGLVMVNGETFYYNQGTFYQQVGNQLVAIPAVLGAVVDSIPVDYQIVMADGDHYLFTRGVYYQRVDQGFQVVQGPGPDQE